MRLGVYILRLVVAGWGDTAAALVAELVRVFSTEHTLRWVSRHERLPPLLFSTVARSTIDHAMQRSLARSDLLRAEIRLLCQLWAEARDFVCKGVGAEMQRLLRPLCSEKAGVETAGQTAPMRDIQPTHRPPLASHSHDVLHALCQWMRVQQLHFSQHGAPQLAQTALRVVAPAMAARQPSGVLADNVLLDAIRHICATNTMWPSNEVLRSRERLPPGVGGPPHHRVARVEGVGQPRQARALPRLEAC